LIISIGGKRRGGPGVTRPVPIRARIAPSPDAYFQSLRHACRVWPVAASAPTAIIVKELAHSRAW